MEKKKPSRKPPASNPDASPPSGNTDASPASPDRELFNRLMKGYAGLQLPVDYMMKPAIIPRGESSPEVDPDSPKKKAGA